MVTNTITTCLTGTRNGSQGLVGVTKQTVRERVVKDPRLLDLFMAASAPAAPTLQQNLQPRGVAVLASDRRPLLSGAQAADIVWACGLLRWLPSDDSRLEKLLELVAQTAGSPSGIDGWHITNVVWALDRLNRLKSEADRAVFCRGNGAIDDLRKRVTPLPFRAISSLFEGLRVEDFTKEVAFGRDEIQLGGGKVCQMTRSYAFPPEGKGSPREQQGMDFDGYFCDSGSPLVDSFIDKIESAAVVAVYLRHK